MGKILNSLRNAFEYKEPFSYDFMLSNGNTEPNTSISAITESVSSDINNNLNFIKTQYSTLINSDIKIREFFLNCGNKKYKAFILFIDGLIDANSINRFVLNPLMFKSNIKKVQSNHIDKAIIINKKDELQSFIMESIIPENDIQTSDKFSIIINLVNNGFTALFVDTIPSCFLIDAKGYEKRSIVAPKNEFVIRGSQESFIESVRTNTSLIRRLINSENLIIETTNVGKVNNNMVCICYIKNIVNPDLISEVKYRINNLDIDYVISSGELEQFISDSQFNLPQVVSTERPDRVASFLLEGRVAIIVNGTPYVLVVPAVFSDFLTSSEDKNIRYQYANLLRIIRAFALFITLILPGFYIALTTFHQEIIPTELLFAIVSTRNSIPFPIIFEILIMDISLELIRESGIRVPAPMGQTIGIVGRINFGGCCC